MTTPPNPPLESDPGAEIASVQFPDMFKEQLARFIPNGARRVFFLEDGLHEEVALYWRSYVLLAADTALAGHGAITTTAGHLDVPALILDFEFGHSNAGTPFVVFNRVTPFIPLTTDEDDSD